MFLVYSCLSTKEGLFTETTVKDQDIRFEKYNEDLYPESEWCYQVFETEKTFKENAFMCNECFKLVKMEDIREVISPKIYIFQTENEGYTNIVCTNIDRYFAGSIFREKNVKEITGKVSRETLSIY